MLNLDKFKITLKAKGLKSTPQRMAVHKAMLALEHACAEQVAAEIKLKGGTPITTSSVYNILSQLSSIGIYRQVSTPDSKMFFDIETLPHAHIFNKKTNELVNIPDEGIMQIVGEHFLKKRFRGLKVENIDITLNCRPSRGARKKKF